MRFLAVTLIVFLTSCSMSGGNGTHFKSYGNYYTVELIDFNKKEIDSLKKQLHNKTFNIKTEEIIWPSKGHTFLIQASDKKWKYHFKIWKKADKDNSLSINIQGFKNENGKLRRGSNPGNFDTHKYSSYHKNKYNALRFLLIQLSYK